MSRTGSDPLFSVIVPSRDRPERLRTCLQSLSDGQGTDPGFEVVVVDDGSRIPCGPVVEPFRNRLALVFRSQPGHGPAAARNNGARHASGRYLFFLDDDCELPPGMLARAAAFVAPDLVVGGQTVNRLADNPYAEASQTLIDHLYGYYNADRDNAVFLTSNNLIVPRAIFEALDGFDTDFTDAAAEDRDLCDRLVGTGHRIAYRPELKVHHRHHMQFGGFAWQHFRYGRGALGYHRKRAQRRGERVRVEPPGFYTDLLRHPFRNRCERPHVVSTLLLASQLFNAAGFFWARATSRRS